MFSGGCFIYFCFDVCGILGSKAVATHRLHRLPAFLVSLFNVRQCLKNT